MLVGSQVPTFSWGPGGGVEHAEGAIEVASLLGLTPDPWQEDVLRTWMRSGDAGRWAAGRWGIAVPRQSGKNALVEIIEMYCAGILGMQILHTAHETKTATKAFDRVAAFFSSGPFADRVKEKGGIYHGRGEQAIWLKNGGSIEFIARTKHSGRGFTVDMLVFDEAQDFDEDALAALLPTISAAPQGDPVQVILGTPPTDSVKGAVFRRVYDLAHEEIDPRLAWCEWAATGDVDVTDRDLWASTNPALGRRVLESTVADECGSFSTEYFARERLGMWSSDKELSIIPSSDWEAALVDDAPVGEIAAIGLDMNPERTVIAVSVAVKTPTGTHVELARIEAPDSTSELVTWIQSRAGRRVPVVVDAYSPARSLEPSLKQARVKTFALSGSELMQACGGFYDAVTVDGAVTHIGQEQLTNSLIGAKRQSIGDAGGWKWSRKFLDSDLTPIMAVTCAWFGAEKFVRQPGPNKPKGRLVFV